jgi:hypothetical protein
MNKFIVWAVEHPKVFDELLTEEGNKHRSLLPRRSAAQVALKYFSQISEKPFLEMGEVQSMQESIVLTEVVLQQKSQILHP